MTVVISQGKAVPVGDAKSWPLAGIERGRMVSQTKTIDLIGLDMTAAYAGIYASQPWIYTTVNKLARGISRLPLRAYREDATNGSRSLIRRAEGHDLPALLSRPFPRGSTRKLIEHTIGGMAIYGHALWWKYRPGPGQPPVELWPIDWRFVTIKTGDNAPIDYYEYRGPYGYKRFLPDEVVHFEWWSPAGAKGTSPLEPLRTTLALEDAARRYSAASFANGIRPSGALVSERPIRDADARNQLKAEIEAIHSNPDNAFRMLLLDGGLDWKPFGQTAADAELINLRKLDREEAAAVYDIPPPMIQILDRATFSNIDEQHQMLYVDTFGPWLFMLEDTIAAQLLWGEPMLQNAIDPEDQELEETLTAFDLSELLRPDIAKRATAYVQMRVSGAWTADDAREAEGKPKFDTPEARAWLTPLNYEMHAGDETDRTAIDEATASRSPAPSEQAVAALQDAMQKAWDAGTAETKALLHELEQQRDAPGVPEAILALAKAMVDKEPPRFEAPELKIEDGAFRIEIPPVEVELPEPAPRAAKQVVTPVRDDGGNITQWLVEETTT